ncbi:hypothetical protein [Parenemella sanctibonifatiensis]|uniref:SHOCT domain-containing protein n=1 Tax=Parenemella sanctibonifatiensis TaxID=2016505 RepID=A0A255DXH3_9ACTN|nr:hypothetical protein [Parenemella sanctibonifatiensis]OYN84027.1 hypothetical protein CGZ92_13280 [Parenemella sanctibonifatiensis]
MAKREDDAAALDELEERYEAGDLSRGQYETHRRTLLRESQGVPMLWRVVGGIAGALLAIVLVTWLVQALGTGTMG